MKTKILKLLFFSLIATLNFSCSLEEKVGDTPEAAFKIAQDFEKSDRLQIAIQRYSDVKNKFPYSALATEAELAIADIYFKMEDFAEAQVSYQNFREFHPKHPKVDYAIFRAGLSYFQQLPDSIDRDLTLANDAIYSFNELIKKFPESTFKSEAEDYRRKAFIMLNEKELYIADFYFKNKMFDSALNRYEMSYKKFSGFGLDARSVVGAIRSARELNDTQKEKRYLEILNAKFGDSSEAKLLKSGGPVE
jgi:outer membrane protein assembly factor BamD